MSVFTPLERPELEAFLAPYGLGRLKDFQGIAEGSENSNFFVSLERGEFVLTLVERGPSHDLPFFIELLDVLHEADLPVPFALRTADGKALRELAGKPALLQPRLPGKHVHLPNAHHCAEVGALLARLHLATRERVLERKSDRGLDWMLNEGPALALQLDDTALPLMRDALREIGEVKERFLALPRANLHADLFKDNALFDGTHLSGVIDFYNACSGPMLYDLAICLNDWCSDADGRLDKSLARALLGAYATLRPFTAAEAELWPTALRIACVRFWLSRLIAANAFAGQDVLIHDPNVFQMRLAQRQKVELPLPFAL
ncbi:homoserine kinase [Pseudomonas sp. JS3066]|jgi:homoserine kinase type II|uniref:homoserine kinase n=1 Tax=unclassified Pseudomonas TaxID=196821 RepID=UPI000EAAA53F|nr:MULTISPECIES: homoserine kinase [unclassified Pseudomonas]AYF89269.1 homoserine kinase [Pseudomonas sp. DY-1]MDH4655781.1 homoserine kinase [Pseudomonas sp. BN606]MRK21614.1 homoserine kinase [Pseudomonas sp. JG-B]WVK93183.1 homoserine kinase [Pseudomonas sp. JS3066]